MNGWIWVVTYLFLWASGKTVTTLFRTGASDRLVRLALQIALGLSIWPIVFLLTSTLGIAWTPVAMRIVVIVTIVLGIALTVWRAGRWPAGPPAASRRGAAPTSRRWTGRRAAGAPLLATFAFLALLAIATRVSHIRELAFPPWVDGIHHAMIVRLILEQGVVPATADPYIGGAAFGYHWGFHVPAAFVAATTGHLAHSDQPALLLHFGQALNALTLLMVYAAGRVLLRSREGGLFAAVLAVFVSYFPAFYLSWGRYTHLAGTLVLPSLLIALWRLTRSPRWLGPAAILAAGLVLIHVRIALFALTFALVLLCGIRARRTALLRWSVAAVVAVVLTGPWLYDLARNPILGDVIAPADAEGLPMHLVGSQRNRELLAVATAGVSGMAGWLGMPRAGRLLSALWWLAIVVVSRYEPKSARVRRRMPWRALALIGAWVLLLAVVLYWRPFGLDLTALSSVDSAIITMFLPLSITGAALLSWVLFRMAPRMRDATTFIAAALLALLGAASVRDVVNPRTVLAEEADLRAMRWIERHVPRDAVFAVDARSWMPPAWVGNDGGYWLHVTTGRRTILPPLLYAWSLPDERVRAINSLLTTWADPTPDAGTWGALRRAGITHIYVGARGDEDKRRALLASPRARAIHREGGAVVFAVAR
jgi:hypothetical protein